MSDMLSSGASTLWRTDTVFWLTVVKCGAGFKRISGVVVGCDMGFTIENFVNIGVATFCLP